MKLRQKRYQLTRLKRSIKKLPYSPLIGEKFGKVLYKMFFLSIPIFFDRIENL